MDQEKAPVTTASDLFSSTPKRRFRLVKLPVLGATIRIRSLTEAELAGWSYATYSSGEKLKKTRMLDATRRLLGLCIVDAEGNRLLSDEDVGRLTEWDSIDTQTAYNECAEHVGLRRGDIEELVKN